MAPSPSTISSEVSISGRISGDGELSVQGTVEGDVALQAPLTVEEQGRVIADVDADKVVVHGELKGEVVARESIELLAGSTVTGNLRAPRIIIQEGARFQGNVDMDVDLE